MIVLEAPYELILSTLFLPSPRFGDNLSLGLSINNKRSINNTQYTYVKRKQHNRLTYSFALSFEKSLELEAFVESYITSWLKLTTHESDIWRVRLTSEPFSYTHNRFVEVSLTFEGTIVNAATINC